MKFSKFTGLLIPALLFTIIVQTAMAQNSPPNALDAVETMLVSDGETSIETFIDQAMVPDEDRDRTALVKHLRAIRNEVRGHQDGVTIADEPDGARLIFSSGTVEKHIKVHFGLEGISDLYLLQVEAPEPIDLTRDNLMDTFDRIEAEGISGVVYIRLDSEVVLERAFGMANEELEIPNALNTVFGTGSRPIDYTRASIYLLDQQGIIDQDDSISKYFENVPADKKSITIRHLMTGRSGLPDFFHTKDDRDPDLSWIDRRTAEQRLLSMELLFTPGEDRADSHSAFGLLAALIERVSGQDYYGFIRQNFLDPAEMNRTGEYGESGGLSVSDFAVGGGPQFVGLPNIPPNWGPTSWLIKGSGGMYSTLGDLLKFYDYLRSGEVLDNQHNPAFRQLSINLDGSDRGFELFSAYNPSGNEVYLLLNNRGDGRMMHQLFAALERLVEIVE